MNSDDTWKVIAVTGTLSIAMSSSALAAHSPLASSDQRVRLQTVRGLAQQDGFVVRNRGEEIIVAGPDEERFNKVDPVKPK
jgi:hypothetical protein